MDKAGTAVEATTSGTSGFFKYVFAFDDEVKCQIGNMLQYAIMALLPVLGILKAVQHIIPEEDPKKGSVLLGVESAAQVALVLVLMWLSDRVIRYFPTLSGCAYGDFQPVAFLLPFLLIMSTMQTKLGAKLGMIMDRVIGDDGEAHEHQGHHQGESPVRVTQPLVRHGHTPPPVHQPSQADTLGSQRLVPDDRQLTAMPAPHVPSHVKPQQSPDFEKMYQGPTTPLQNAATPGGSNNAMPQAPPVTEPMAANEVLGGGMGSAW